jgi:hypothetical protein
MRKWMSGLACAGFAVLLAGCGGSDGNGSGGPIGGGGPANRAPTASAGFNQTVMSGVAVTLNGSLSIDADGSIASYAWTQTAGTVTVTLSSTSIAQPTFAAPQVLASTPLTFSLVVTDDDGAVSTAATTIVTVTPAVQGQINLTGRITFERVMIATLPPRGLVYASPLAQPARGVIVHASTGQATATATTDANGNYTVSVPNNTNVTLQVVAQMLRDDTQPLPRWDVRVQNGTVANTPAYTFSDGPFNSSVGTRDVDIPTGISANGTASGTRGSGPFAALDTIYRAMQTVLGADPTIDFPALVVDWGSQSDGTFFTSAPVQHIALLADLASDTDEFDQHVIAHEFGHYLEFNFSRADNIGGSHGLGDRLDPRVAFGEGWGYAFAAIALGNTDSRDTFSNNGTQMSAGFDIERNPTTPGTGGDGDGCWCSESSVWSLIYDVYDNNADLNDNLALGFAPIWTVLKGAERDTDAVTSIFSFVTALKAAGTGQNSQIDTLVAAQNITASGIDAFATTETHSPLTPSSKVLPLFTPITLNTPVVVSNSDDAGNYNKAGNHRFLRFVPATNGDFHITLTTSNPDPAADPDFVVYARGARVVTATSPPTAGSKTQLGTLTNATAGRTYILDVYDCANGCQEQGTPGDYDLTVTIN